MPPPMRLTDSDYVYLLLQEILLNQVLQLFVIVHYLTKINSRKRKRNTQAAPYRMIPRIPDQVKHMSRIIGLTDVDYVVNLRMDRNAFVKPQPVPDDYTDSRWKWFKGYLGALDGTYINVTVINTDKPKYRTRKGQISTNVLAVCDRKMQFVYVLSGWEGSAADSRILRDALNRANDLKVPRGALGVDGDKFVDTVESSPEWNAARDHLADGMWNDYINAT
ncbi:hypothetical protein C2S53_008557 [Perilla frutescens var. hirtella]|uniref:DDE Tnp4 domain-containing protein n=1 Tax=Perilla frutescens var. hirtella TaxID=608512 RepID=A0AAD4PF66_PERFH|nr:hypothetical protein C2S53_008557 [Perilla frutescens var. hirtella]